MDAVEQALARTRTFSWQDPVAAAARGRAMSGLEFLSAIVEGTLPPPPIAELFGFSVIEVQHGRAVFAMEPAEWMYNPIGSVHGGVAATLLDSCMSCAVQTTIEAGLGYTTLEIKVNLVRAITKDTGLIRATGRLIHRGRTTGTAEGDLRDAGGTLLAHGTTTCMIFSATK